MRPTTVHSLRASGGHSIREFFPRTGPWRVRSCAIAALLLAGLQAGCTREVHRPQPIDAAASAAAYEARTLADPGLRDYLKAQGLGVDPWPRTTWDLEALAAAAVYLHPDVELARSRARLAAAEKATSTTRPPITLTVRPELNNKVEHGETPWGLGVLAGLPFDLGDKRGARTAQLARLEEAAQLEVAVAGWRVRSRLRRHLVDLYVAETTLHALEAEQAARNRLLALLEKRLAVGYAGAGEIGALQVKVAEGELALRRATVRREQAFAGVAEAVGVLPERLQPVRLDFTAVAGAVRPPAGDDVRRTALLHRIDLRRKLADYAAAEAAVKLEVARQYPDITLIPGYFWDTNDAIWSIALSAFVPPRARTRALIREAEARREVEGHAFVALQASVISEASAAAARYRQAYAVHEAARRQIEVAAARRTQVARQFDRGHADRVELVQAELDAATVDRAASVALLELQQGLSALEDALQRPLDNADFAAAAPASPGPAAETALNPALIDND